MSRTHEVPPPYAKNVHPSLLEKVTKDTSTAHFANLPLIEKLVKGINESQIVDFQLSIISTEPHKETDHTDITFTATKPVEHMFFAGSGPLWSSIRALELMQNAWDHEVTQDEATLMFKLAYQGVNVDNEVVQQHNREAPLGRLQQRLQSLVAE